MYIDEILNEVKEHAVERIKNRNYREKPDPRERYWFSGSTDRDPDEENQRSDCSSEVPQERPPLQTWSAEDGWSQKKPAELPEEEGR